MNVVLHPINNPDGAQLSVDLAKITPDNLLHPGYHGALSADVSAGQGETDPIYPESRTRRQLIEAWLPDAFLNPHGYPSHEWVQPFSEYTGWVQSRQGANTGRAWWIPRGWFTSMGYLRDPEHPDSKQIAYALQDRIVEAERNVPGLLPLENRMNARYERFGQRWQPRDMFQPIVGWHSHLYGAEGIGRTPSGAVERVQLSGAGRGGFAGHHLGRGLYRSARRNRARRLHEADGVRWTGVRLSPSEVSCAREIANHSNGERSAQRSFMAGGTRTADSAASGAAGCISADKSACAWSLRF